MPPARPTTRSPARRWWSIWSSWWRPRRRWSKRRWRRRKPRRNSFGFYVFVPPERDAAPDFYFDGKPMANVLQPVRGTRDLIGDDAARHFHVVETARRITSLYGFSEWQTPIFEDTKEF